MKKGANKNVMEVKSDGVPPPPQLLWLMGTSLFVVLSLSTSLIERHFPGWMPYTYLSAGLAGSILLYLISLSPLTDSASNISVSILYLLSAVASVLATNGYIAFKRRDLKVARIFAVSVTLPTILLSALFTSGLVKPSLLPFPILPLESLQGVPVVLIIATTVLSISFVLNLVYEKRGEEVRKQI